jgi:hypothetical protein
MRGNPPQIQSNLSSASGLCLMGPVHGPVSLGECCKASAPSKIFLDSVLAKW